MMDLRVSSFLETMGSMSCSSRSIFVRNLPGDIREKEVDDLFYKISKQQFELVENLKNGGDGIQSKSLDRVIGDISDFSIHPYEGFGEEEKKRLHKHWLLVVRKDIPAAFQERRGKALHKEEWGSVYTYLNAVLHMQVAGS